VEPIPGLRKGSASLPTKVGIFTPCFNLGSFLPEAVSSVKKQTFTDYVHVIADDASTDNKSASVVKSINAPRTNVFFETTNLGLVRIANKYMSQLDAEYIMLFNADDILEPEFLEKHVEYLDTHPDVAAVSCSVQMFGDEDGVIEYSEEGCALPQMLVENRFSGAALMRKSAWLTAGKHDEDDAFYPNLDYELWLSFLSHGLKLGTIPEILFNWRVRKSSLSHQLDIKRWNFFQHALLAKYSSLYEIHAEWVIGHLLDKEVSYAQNYLDAEEAKLYFLGKIKSLESQVAHAHSNVMANQKTARGLLSIFRGEK
jgi:GT2 family glycosyltransferase